jgi:hypothetical protein
MRPGSGWVGDGQADPEGAALALDRAGADLAAHHVDHAAGDRQAEAEALLLARLVAAVEALEDALDLRLGMPVPVSITSKTPPARRRGGRER